MSVPPATQKPCTLHTTGLSEWNRLMKPRTLRLIIWKSTTGSQVALGIVVLATAPPDRAASPRELGLAAEALHLALGRRDEVVAAAEALAVAGERDHVDLRVEVGPLDARGELARHLEGDPVAALGPVERDPRDPARSRRSASAELVRCASGSQIRGRWRRRTHTTHRGGRATRSELSNPASSSSPRAGHTKLDLVEYYLAVADAALSRTCANGRRRSSASSTGSTGEFFFQKRVPKGAPDWLQTATVTFPSGRSAARAGRQRRRAPGLGRQPRRDRLQPLAVRRADLDRPDELRVDLDPTPEATWDECARSR